LIEVEEARRVVDEVARLLRGGGVSVQVYHDNTSSSQDENLDAIVAAHNSYVRDVDVSVHFNAFEETSGARGTEVLYYSEDELAEEMSEAISVAGGLINRGPKQETGLAFLRNTDEPAILIEVAFVDAKQDVELYQKNFGMICLAIAETLAEKSLDGVPDRPAAPEPPDTPPTRAPDTVLKIGDSGPSVERMQKILGLPADGEFGTQAEAGVYGFQAAYGLGADGVVGPATWEELIGLERRMIATGALFTPALEQAIVDIAKGSAIAAYSWDDRGEAPDGYIPGMALAFAYAVQALAAGNGAVEEMAAAEIDDDDDVLNYYAAKFEALDMDNSEDGVDTLRHLFAFLIGLGMRESSGNHWCGRDQSADNTTPETAEAGLFQGSWNLSSCNEEINALLEHFLVRPQGFRHVFTEGLNPSPDDLRNFGSGDRGTAYQWLAKYCPLFAVLMTGVGLRKRCDHWGPVVRQEVELVEEAEEMLRQVQELVTR
jgi:hypothetical protein